MSQKGIKLFAITHQSDQEEVNDFKNKFWPNAPLYQDPDRVFFAELGGGSVRRGNLLSLLNPFGKSAKNFSSASKNVKDWNMKGDGTVLGGTFVLSPSQVLYQFKEDQVLHFGLSSPSKVLLLAHEVFFFFPLSRYLSPHAQFGERADVKDLIDAASSA
jgi:hypothetical protein